MYSKYLNWIEDEIKAQHYGDQPASLYDPIQYIMALGGKRLRPMLVLLAYGLYKNDVRKVVPHATAVEAFHNFTLLHDDIMDNAPLRRGKKTVHEKWNVNTAILSGDVMLVKVYDQLLKIKPGILKEVIAKFNACATEVCEGQQWDMEFETMKSVTIEQYIDMIRQKTAVLLGFSLELGALLADAPKADQKSLYQLGVNIGIGFQLKDDWLDVYGDGEKFGKQVGGDILSNKKTYLLLKALAIAKGNSKKELMIWLSSTQFDKKEKVKAITNIYNQLKVSEVALKEVNSYFDKGLASLNRLKVPASKKRMLKDFTIQLIDRNS